MDDLRKQLDEANARLKEFDARLAALGDAIRTEELSHDLNVAHAIAFDVGSRDWELELGRIALDRLLGGVLDSEVPIETAAAEALKHLTIDAALNRLRRSGREFLISPRMSGVHGDGEIWISRITSSESFDAVEPSITGEFWRGHRMRRLIQLDAEIIGPNLAGERALR